MFLDKVVFFYFDWEPAFHFEIIRTLIVTVSPEAGCAFLPSAMTILFKRNISAEVRVVPLYLGLMVTPLIVGEHSLFPRLQF